MNKGLIFILSFIFLILVVAFGLSYEKLTKSIISSDSEDIGSITLNQEEIGIVCNPFQETSYDSKTNNYITKLYSEQQFIEEDRICKPLKDARSLLSLYNITYEKYDKDFPLKIININSSGIEFERGITNLNNVGKDINFNITSISCEKLETAKSISGEISKCTITEKIKLLDTKNITSIMLYNGEDIQIKWGTGTTVVNITRELAGVSDTLAMGYGTIGESAYANHHFKLLGGTSGGIMSVLVKGGGLNIPVGSRVNYIKVGFTTVYSANDPTAPDPTSDGLGDQCTPGATTQFTNISQGIADPGSALVYFCDIDSRGCSWGGSTGSNLLGTEVKNNSYLSGNKMGKIYGNGSDYCNVGTVNINSNTTIWCPSATGSEYPGDGGTFNYAWGGAWDGLCALGYSPVNPAKVVTLNSNATSDMEAVINDPNRYIFSMGISTENGNNWHPTAAYEGAEQNRYRVYMEVSYNQPPQYYDTKTNYTYSKVGEQVNFSTGVFDDIKVDKIWFSHDFEINKTYNVSQLISTSTITTPSNYYSGQQFRSSTAGKVYNITLMMSNYSQAQYDFIVEIRKDSSGKPDMSTSGLLGNSTILSSSFTLNTATNQHFIFQTPVSISANTWYWVTARHTSSTRNLNYKIWGKTTNAYEGDRAYCLSGFSCTTAQWTNAQPGDFYFNINIGEFYNKNETKYLLDTAKANYSFVYNPKYAGTFTWQFCANDSENNIGCSSTPGGGYKVYENTFIDTVVPVVTWIKYPSGNVNGQYIPLSAVITDNQMAKNLSLAVANGTNAFVLLTSNTIQNQEINISNYLFNSSYYENGVTLTLKAFGYDLKDNYAEVNITVLRDANAPTLSNKPTINPWIIPSQLWYKNGEVIQIRVNATDGASGAGLNKSIIDIVNINGGGTIDMSLESGDLSTGTFSTFNYTGTINIASGKDKLIRMDVYDSASPTKNVMNVTIPLSVDNTPPTWDSLSVQPTGFAGDNITHSVGWKDYLNNSDLTSGLSGLDTCILSTNASGSWVNASALITGQSMTCSLGIVYASAGKFGYIFYANDTKGNLNNTGIGYITITSGTVPIPTVSLISPVDDYNSTTNNLSFSINVTGLTDAQLDSCFLYIDTILNQTNLTASFGALTTFDVISLELYSHSWYASCNNSENAIGSSAESRIFNISIEGGGADTTPPYFSPIPQNASVVYLTDVIKLINATDNGVNNTGIDCYTVNDTRFSINCTGGLINTTSLGVMRYWVNVSANDTSNNWNSTYFFIDILQLGQIITPELNGANNNLIITYPQQMNATHTGTNKTELTLNINGTVIKEGLNYTIGAGFWIVNWSAPENQNYSAIKESLNITVNQSAGLTNAYVNQSAIQFNATFGTTANNTYLNGTLTTGTGDITLWLNGVTINTGASPLYNISNLSLGYYNFSVVYLGNQNYTLNITTIWINVSSAPVITPDTTPPYFTPIPSNQTATVNMSFSYQINASDASGISCFTVNDTNFTINCSGYLTNNTALVSIVTYWVNVSVNDTYNNWNSTYFSITISADSTAPIVTIIFPIDGGTYVIQPINLNITATDASGISSCWWTVTSGVTNTTFTPNSTTMTGLVLGTHYPLYTYCNDTLNNVGYDNIEFDFLAGLTDDEKLLWVYVIVTFLFIVLLILAYYFENPFFGFMSGMLFLILGVYEVINGFPGISDTNLEVGIGIVIIGIGAYVLVTSGLKYMEWTGGDSNESGFEEEE